MSTIVRSSILEERPLPWFHCIQISINVKIGVL